MGYTHYWKIRHPFTNQNWNEFVGEVKSLFDTTSVPLANGCGEEGTTPIINDTEILFNGVGDDGCETCHISKNRVDFEFCKTRQLPYDEIVVKVLTLARNYNTSIELMSDGGPAVFD